MRWLLTLVIVAVATALATSWLVAEPDREATVDTSHVVPVEHASGPTPAALEIVDASTAADAPVDGAPARADDRERAPVAPSSSDELVEVAVRVVYQNGEKCALASVHCDACERALAARRLRPTSSFSHQTDVDGRTSIALPSASSAKSVTVWAEAKDETYFSQPYVVADLRNPPPEIVLTLERAVRLRVAVRAFDGAPVAGARIDVSPTSSSSVTASRHDETDERGEASANVPRGDYRIVAVDPRTLASAETTVAAREDRRVDLDLPAVPLAVSGVVVDERGRGLANVALTVKGFQLKTGSAGRFELHLAPCEPMDLLVVQDPMTALFEPASMRVAHGTTDVRIERKKTWESMPLRIHVLDATTRTDAQRPKLVLSVPGVEGQRIYQGHDGWIEAQVPRRDDLMWRLDAFGCKPIEGGLAELAPGFEKGVIELSLPHDPSEVEPPPKQRAPNTAPPPKPKGVRRP